MGLSDHGVQMAKKTAKEFFRDLGIKQLFARYQTPEDNAWIESWFRILKYDWLRYKDYVTFEGLRVILGIFIDYYNSKRYHGSIGYVTPFQMHSGDAERVLEERRQRKEKARIRRLEVNGAAICSSINRNLITQEQLKEGRLKMLLRATSVFRLTIQKQCSTVVYSYRISNSKLFFKLFLKFISYFPRTNMC